MGIRLASVGPSLGEVVHDSLDAILKDETLKLISSPICFMGRSQICQQLGRMDGQDLFDGFEFHQNCVLHEQIDPVTTVQLQAFVAERQMDFASESNARTAQFIADAFLICRLEQPRAQVPMNLDRSRDDPMCDPIGSATRSPLLCCLCISLRLSLRSLRLRGEKSHLPYSLGAGFHSKIFFNISSCFRRSDSAWKFNRIL